MMLASEDLRPDTGGYFLQLFYVFVVLIIIVAAIILLVRFLGRRNQSWMQGRSIRTLGALGLGPNKSIQLIEVGNSLYLVGVGEDITLVDKITDPAEIELLKASIGRELDMASGALPPFIGKLAARFRKDHPPEDIELENQSSFHEVFESKLRSVQSRKEKVEEMLREDQKDS